MRADRDQSPPRRGTIRHPRPVLPEEIGARRLLARVAAIAARPLAFPGLSALLRTARLALEIDYIDAAPAVLPREIVPVALEPRPGDRSFRAVLALPFATARSVVDRALGRARGSERGDLTSGEEGALLYAIDRAGGDWIAAGGPRFVVRGILADTDQVADYLGAIPSWQIAARLVGEASSDPLWLWTSVLAGDIRIAPPPVRVQLGDLPVSWRVIVGHARAPARELDSLSAGDVVVLDRLCHPLAQGSRAGLRLVSGGVTRSAQWLDRRRLQLVSSDERRPPMPGKPDDATAVATTLAEPLDAEIGGMEVLVQVEVGRVAIALEQALSLVEGAVLELDRDVGPRVQLRVGDRLLARGELVDCEGRLSVQITEVP
jgi:type III secretion system YscQ/HrcQ family protein